MCQVLLNNLKLDHLARKLPLSMVKNQQLEVESLTAIYPNRKDPKDIHETAIVNPP